MRRKKKLLLTMLVSFGFIFALTVISNQWILIKRYFFIGPSSFYLKGFAATLFDGGIMTAHSLTVLFDQKKSTENLGVDSIQIRVQPGSLEKMVSNLPQSAKGKYYPASMLFPDGTWKNIDYRLRGSNIWHWHPNKPSLRLKLSKKNPINLQRFINLTNPEDRGAISNIAGEALAKKMGVLVPITNFATLFLNGKYMGLYHQTTRKDEEFLRLAGRIPGPLFSGKRLGKEWEVADFEISGDTDVLAHTQPMKTLIKIIYSPMSSERYRKLWKVLSFEKLAGWQATMNLVGGVHTDDLHNHFYYFDPTLGQLEPVVDDVNGHGLLRWGQRFARLWFREHAKYKTPLNETIHPLSNVAFRDPNFQHKRNEFLFKALNSFGSEREQNKLLNSYYKKIDRAMHADQRKAAIEQGSTGGFRYPYGNWLYERSKKDVSIWVTKRNDFLRTELAKSFVSFSLKENKNDGFQLAVEVDGVSSVKFNTTLLPGNIFAHRNLKPDSKSIRIKNSELLHPGLAETGGQKCHQLREGFPAGFWAETTGIKYCLTPGPQLYLFTVQTKDRKLLVEQLLSSFSNAITQAKIKPEKKSPAQMMQSKNKVVLHPWEMEESIPQVISLGPGIVHLRDTLVVREKDSLIVKPGTHLKLASGVSIASKGKVLFDGNEKNPITVEPLVKKTPWGSIIFHQKGAKGSIIRYTSFSGGSFAKGFNVKFSGMVSAHNVGSITIENSKFDGNILSDDLFHIVYGKAEIRNTELSNCFADCLDLDYVNLNAQGVSIKNARNDGIDFMGSTAKIRNTTIENIGDKGLSIGERTTVTLSHGKIRNAINGIAVKDDSTLSLSDVVLEENEVAISVFKKNWRFGKPGKVLADRTKFLRNQVNLEVEEGGIFHSKQPLPSKYFGSGTIQSVKVD